MRQSAHVTDQRGRQRVPAFPYLRLKRAFENVLIARLILSSDYAYQFPAFLAECVGSDFDNGPRTVSVIDLAVFVSLYEFMLEPIRRHSCMRLHQVSCPLLIRTAVSPVRCAQLSAGELALDPRRHEAPEAF